MTPLHASLLDQPNALTPRQHEVLTELEHGLTNKEIACELGISPSTVRIHLIDVCSRLGVRNRAQAAQMKAD